MRGAKRLLAAGIVAAGIAALPQAAPAGVIIHGGGVNKIPDPFYQYVFQVYLDGGTTGAFLAKGDYFTVYDIPSLNPGSNSQLGPDNLPLATWNATFADTGQTPPQLSPPPTDSASLLNVTWVFQGTGVGNNELQAAAGQSLFIGTFYVSTTSDATGYAPVLTYAAETDGGTAANMGTFSTVPEPSSILMLGMGTVIGSAVLWRFRGSPVTHCGSTA